MNRLLTIVIPTRNRADFLARLLGYYRDQRFSHKLIIADSSDAEQRSRSKDVVEVAAKDLNVDYQQYDPETEFTAKLSQAVALVSTPYMAVGADDDFFVLATVDRALTFLASQPDYAVVHGDSAIFITRSGLAHGPLEQVHRYDQRTIDDSGGLARLTGHLNHYSTTFYSIHRTEQFRSCYQTMISIAADLYFSELLHSCLTLIQGKAKKLDGLYLVRQGFVAKEYEVLDVFDWIARPGWGEQYERFRDCLAEELSQQDGIEIDQARKVIKEIFSHYLSTFLKSSGTRVVVPNSLRQVMRSIPVARPIWHALRSLNPEAKSEINLPALLRPSSPYHAEFMPIYRAITKPGDDSRHIDR